MATPRKTQTTRPKTQSSTAKSKAKSTSKPRTKTTAKASMPASNNATKRTSQDIEQHYKIKYELKMIALLAFTLFTMLSLYTQAVGEIGLMIKSVYLGLFSYVGYVLPVFIFGYIFIQINHNLRPIRTRFYVSMTLIILGALLLVTMMVFPKVNLELFKVETDFTQWTQFVESFNRSIHLKGGGVVGELISLGILNLVGNIGAFIMILACFISGFIIFTRISIQDLWEHKKGLNQQRKLRKQEEDLVVQKMIEDKKTDVIQQGQLVLKIKNKNPSQMEEESNHFLDTLDAFKKSTRKKDVKVFDYDSYEHAEVNSSEIKPINNAHQSFVESVSGVKHQELNTPFEETIEPKVAQAFKTVAAAIATGETIAEKKFTVKDLSTPAVQPSSETIKEALKPELKEQKVVKLKEKDIDPETRQLVNDEIKENVTKSVEHYVLPPLSLLQEPIVNKNLDDQAEYLEMAKLLEETLNNFSVDAKVISVKRGPSITMFEVQLSPGVKVSKVVGLTEDIALNLATSHVRIAPIPGKAAIGIEVPNKVTSMVVIKEVLNSQEFKKQTSKLTIGLGKDISGNAIVGDLASMPHLLIAGATGSGKSVCVNTIISSILFSARPDEVKFLMIDPKVVELSIYNGIPHLILPVVTDAKKASIALNWAVNEMTRRYKLFAEQTVRDMKGYNKKAQVAGIEILPQIVVIIDELADLMMVAPNQVEDAICRLAQMARAAGIHLIVATQRPSVDVITGLIKANIPSRIAFSVSSSIDSRTIIDMGGAEKLLGKGDMLFYPVGAAKPKRTQGAFMSDDEVEKLVEYIKNQALDVQYNESILDEVQSTGQDFDEADEHLEEAIKFVLETGQASASMMQRRFRVGYNRAARLVESMEERGLVGPSRGSKPREVLMTLTEFEMMYSQEDSELMEFEIEPLEAYENEDLLDAPLVDAQLIEESSVEEDYSEDEFEEDYNFEELSEEDVDDEDLVQSEEY